MVSSDQESGNTPSQLTRPKLGFNPTTPFSAAGMRMLPAVSDPIAARLEPAATLAPEPPELPPGMRAGSQGLRAGGLETPAANSCVTVLPTMTAPASRNRLTTRASAFAGPAPARDAEPQRVGSPSMSMMSL